MNSTILADAQTIYPKNGKSSSFNEEHSPSSNTFQQQQPSYKLDGMNLKAKTNNIDDVCFTTTLQPELSTKATTVCTVICTLSNDNNLKSSKESSIKSENENRTESTIVLNGKDLITNHDEHQSIVNRDNNVTIDLPCISQYQFQRQFATKNSFGELGSNNLSSPSNISGSSSYCSNTLQGDQSYCYDSETFSNSVRSYTIQHNHQTLIGQSISSTMNTTLGMSAIPTSSPAASFEPNIHHSTFNGRDVFQGI